MIRQRPIPSFLAFLLTAGSLVIVQRVVRPPMLLAERYLPGAGWLQIVLFAGYAVWLTSKLLDPRGSAHWRRRVWLLFSVVFFTQLLLGLLGIERLLMTGELHLPVPALILAGPLYRGAGLFMPILFTVTVLLVGPAWCSHLCYFGAWDEVACRLRRRPTSWSGDGRRVRIGIGVAVVVVALTLRLVGASTHVAAAVGLAFGVLGLAVMVVWSRRTGVMVHCVTFCPMGLAANLLGKLSPFRIRIKDGCTSCGACRQVCRYDALTTHDVKRRRPGLSCSLCGDCIGVCPSSQLEYRFAWISGDRARTLFIVLAASLHAVFMALARV